MVSQVVGARHNHTVPIISLPARAAVFLIQGFNKGDNPGTLELSKFSSYRSSVPMTAFPSPVLTFVLEISVVYIFYGLWALSPTEVRLL